MNPDFAALLEGWPEENLQGALGEFASDYSLEELTLVVAEARRRGLRTPGAIEELEAGSDAERATIESLRGDHAEERALSQEESAKRSRLLGAAFVVLVVLFFVTAYFLDVGTAVILLLTLPLIGVGVFVVVILINAIRILPEYERGVVFRLGRLQKEPYGPGLFLLIPIVETAQAVPVSPAGWGVAESMYVVLFQDAGETASIALSLALSVRAVTLSQALMGVPGLVLLVRKRRVMRSRT